MKIEDLGVIEMGENRVKKETLSHEAKWLLMRYREIISKPQIVNLGDVTKLEPRFEGDESPSALREYEVRYPESLNQAFALLCEEHDTALMQIVAGHREWSTDYQHAQCSIAFQVDCPAMSDEFLAIIANVQPKVIAEFLKAVVFEVENNIAGYELNSRLWPEGTTNRTWQGMLDSLRTRTGKKIAVLAGTEAKLNAMLMSELGGMTRDNLGDEEQIRKLTGFDAFMGPAELKAHFAKHGGTSSEYLFFGRTSRPTWWLEDPSTVVAEPFLNDSTLRAYARAFAITHNFDDPAHSLYDPRVITDTKAALCAIGGAYLVEGLEDIFSPWFLAQMKMSDQTLDEMVFADQLTDKKIAKLARGKDNQVFPDNRVDTFSPRLINFLIRKGIDLQSLIDGTHGIQSLRLKPLRRYFGAWGHKRLSLLSMKWFSGLQTLINKYGYFALQPEQPIMQVTDAQTNNKYLVIDRVFFVRDESGKLRRMEGIRAFMPEYSPEGLKGNVHDGQHTLDAKIVE